MSTGLLIGESTYDPAKKTVTGYMEGPDMTGKVVKSKSVVEYKPDGSRVFTMYMPDARRQGSRGHAHHLRQAEVAKAFFPRRREEEEAQRQPEGPLAAALLFPSGRKRPRRRRDRTHRLHPRFVAEAVAEAWFAELREAVPCEGRTAPDVRPRGRPVPPDRPLRPGARRRGRPERGPARGGRSWIGETGVPFQQRPG